MLGELLGVKYIMRWGKGGSPVVHQILRHIPLIVCCGVGECGVSVRGRQDTNGETRPEEGVWTDTHSQGKEKKEKKMKKGTS
jgi:hypothetical protein